MIASSKNVTCRAVAGVATLLLLLGIIHDASAQNLINVRLAGGNPGTPSGAAVLGSAGDAWNYFANLGGQASGGGVVTNATTIKDSSGATLSGVAMAMSLSGGDGLDNYSDGTSFNPTPSVIMANYIYENNGANYFTFAFTGLPASKPFMIYGMGNGNQTGQGSTWWVDLASTLATLTVPAPPTSLTSEVAGGRLSLSWPPGQTGFRLLAQTNSAGTGITTNWQIVANSATTNHITIPMSVSVGSTFFQLVYP